MPWRYRPPQAFPATFPTLLRSASASPETPILLGRYPTLSSARAAAASFAHYRWCLRYQPLASFALYSLEISSQFRAKLEHHPSFILVYIIAKPDRVQMMWELNPDLHQWFPPDCQPKKPLPKPAAGRDNY